MASCTKMLYIEQQKKTANTSPLTISTPSKGLLWHLPDRIVSILPGFFSPPTTNAISSLLVLRCDTRVEPKKATSTEFNNPINHALKLRRWFTTFELEGGVYLTSDFKIDCMCVRVRTDGAGKTLARISPGDEWRPSGNDTGNIYTEGLVGKIVYGGRFEG